MKILAKNVVAGDKILLPDKSTRTVTRSSGYASFQRIVLDNGTHPLVWDLSPSDTLDVDRT